MDHLEGHRGVWFEHEGVSLFVTTSVGPRILFLGRPGGTNLFHVEPASGEGWQLYGGHRFWTAPEDALTYALDDDEVHVDGTAFAMESEGLRRTLSLEGAMVRHRLENVGTRPLRRACWALSVLSGGRAFFPRPALRPHPDALHPDRTLSLWPYSDPSDPRFTWGRGAIQLSSGSGGAQKLGGWNPLGWLAWQRGRHLFVKSSVVQGDSEYPDRGCSHELFTSGAMLELESLGPLTTLAPGDSIEHVERWWLLDVDEDLDEQGLASEISALGLDPGGLLA